jgi:hypothetical protein
MREMGHSLIHGELEKPLHRKCLEKCKTSSACSVGWWLMAGLF